MTEQAAREAFYAWVDRLPITTAVSEVPSTKVWLAAWAASEERVRGETLADVEAHAAGYFARAEVISDEYISSAIHNQGVGIINAVQAVRAAREGQDGD